MQEVVSETLTRRSDLDVNVMVRGKSIMQHAIKNDRYDIAAKIVEHSSFSIAEASPPGWLHDHLECARLDKDSLADVNDFIFRRLYTR